MKRLLLIAAAMVGLTTAVVAQPTINSSNIPTFAPTIPAMLPQTNLCYWFSLTIPTNITAGGTSNLTSQPLTIKPGYGFGVEVLQQSATNTTTTSNITYAVNVTLDGTNFQTTAPWSFTVALNGTNLVRYFTNFVWSGVDSVKAVRVDSIKNGDTGSSMTPGGLRLSRPTLIPF